MDLHHLVDPPPSAVLPGRWRRRWGWRRRLRELSLPIQGEHEQHGSIIDRGIRCACPTGGRGSHTHTAHQSDILFAIDFVGDRRRHASSPGLNLEKFLAFVRAVGHQASILNYVEYKISSGGNCPSSNGTAAIRPPN